MINELMKVIRNELKNKIKNILGPVSIVCLPSVCISNYFQQQQ